MSNFIERLNQIRDVKFNNSTSSSTIECRGFAFGALLINAGLTGATIGFEAWVPATESWAVIHDSTGTALTVDATTAGLKELDQNVLASFQQIRVTVATPITTTSYLFLSS